MVVPAASDAVRSQWSRQVTAEYRSSAIAQQLTLWLTQLGASPDLIEAGLRIAQDELDHARESFDVYRAAGGGGTAALDRATLAFAGDDAVALERKVLEMTVNVFCLGETIAVPLFRHLRSGCDVDEPRSVLDRIVRDEPRHSSFGWDLLDWLLAGPCVGMERDVERILPAGFRELGRAYGTNNATMPPPMPDADRAWGLAPRREYAEILAATFERIWRPRFGAHGISAHAPWHASS